MTREEAIQVLNMVEAHGLADEAKRMAIEALSADAENRLYIRIYADDEPSVKAEKLYQICGETQNKEVAEWLKEYFPSAEAEWISITTSEPNTADHVLVTYKWGDDDLEVSELDYWVTKGEADDGNASCKRLIDHVIAWRPMLKPYKEESEVEE